MPYLKHHSVNRFTEISLYRLLESQDVPLKKIELNDSTNLDKCNFNHSGVPHSIFITAFLSPTMGAHLFLRFFQLRFNRDMLNLVDSEQSLAIIPMQCCECIVPRYSVTTCYFKKVLKETFFIGLQGGEGERIRR